MSELITATGNYPTGDDGFDGKDDFIVYFAGGTTGDVQLQFKEGDLDWTDVPETDASASGANWMKHVAGGFGLKYRLVISGTVAGNWYAAFCKKNR